MVGRNSRKVGVHGKRITDRIVIGAWDVPKYERCECRRSLKSADRERSEKVEEFRQFAM